MYVKIGDYRVRLNEGRALRYIHAHTSGVPVPIVVDNFTYDGTTFLVMSRMPGYPLDALYHQITPDVERLLSAQLHLSSFDGGPVRCARVRFDAEPAGPWQSVDEFHEAIIYRTGGLNIPENVDAAAVHDVIRRAHARKHRVCLTHNDLGAHNILVDENWNITGIVDWEAAAWMPEYWELTKGTFLPKYRQHRWFRIMSAAFPMYTLEQKAEQLIIQYRQCYA
ncbi:hypothetical protein EWM64_g5882 [Hericium alpestre]|uniref:Aminoglycoside phosphotransferase domain-containing protein n=1 Tax=Hericium alpestre TaxID=135208 RepID=A0A4Y9ZU63_9AGAM|nr:hypothetical protein EWM64_g5882 [Hericium alpestre]